MTSRSVGGSRTETGSRSVAGTTNGSINSDIPVLTSSSDRHSLRGTINGGGPAELRLHTTNGSIEIKGR